MKIIKAPDLSILKKTHENKWVAFSRDYKKILAVADSLSKLQKKTKEGIVMKVLPMHLSYAPHLS